ncbi:MAG TPA: NapC/NirT family cytochrome c [Thermoanaerobaculia bacterium]|jgi:nitrate/TMAO reductase-like tetraheme cytochrome c subunit|nr:NapC/NirT family cytochrome c [Thermoanaerobaculia bacterium]
MPAFDPILIAVVLAAIALIALVTLRPSLTAARGGRVLAFLAFLVLPLLASAMGLSAHLDHSKSTEFCLSCHPMKPYGQSLHVDDPAWIPAHHFQNNLVPRDHACFTCHTHYTMFGDAKAKLRGLRHVYVYYLGHIPEKIELYEPYNNRECLHCHDGARSFEESDLHKEIRADLASGQISCLECHDTIHNVGDLKGKALWTEPLKKSAP